MGGCGSARRATLLRSCALPHFPDAGTGFAPFPWVEILGRPVAHFLTREERHDESKKLTPAGGAGRRFLPHLPRLSSETRSALPGKNSAHDRRRAGRRVGACTAARRSRRPARGLFTRPG